MHYRPEIDGLRAVAVSAVLLYHAGFSVSGTPILPGGFLGVDIFFVISGYLITAILVQALAEERFSFATFYERRIRRILPALLTVMLATIPCAWLWLFPQPFVEYAQSLVAATLFAANVLFWSQDAYTAEPGAFKPLLHTWSLAVEEQYYLLYPALLLGLWTWLRRYTGLVLGVLLLSSLALAIWASNIHPSANFYGLPTRFWELIVGALLAWSERHSAPSNSHWLATLGLLLIMLSLILLHDAMGLPSWQSILPVTGTALVLYAARGKGWVSRLLAWRPMVSIGLVSYSLYLWHQPVFAFARTRFPAGLSVEFKLLLLVACLALAALTYKYIEQPFRSTSRIPIRRLWMLLGLGSLLVLGAGISGQLYEGFPERLPPVLRKLTVEEIYRGMLIQEERACHGLKVSESCHFPAPGNNLPWYLVGDSNAFALALPLRNALAARDTSFTSITEDGCYYVPGMQLINDGEVQCPMSTNFDRRAVLLAAEPGVVVIAGSLPAYYLGSFRQPELPIAKLQGLDTTISESNRQDMIRNRVLRGLQELLEHGHRLVLVYPVPEFEIPVPRVLLALANNHRQGLAGVLEENSVTTSHRYFRERTAPVYDLFDALGEHPRLLRTYPAAVFCGPLPDGNCRGHDSSAFYYRDAFHLSATGAALLVDNIMQRHKQQWPQ